MVSLPAAANPDTSGRRLRVLVVDDNPDSADSVAMLLEVWGHESRVVYDGETALAVAQEFGPDCMLLDIRMPRMSGYELAERSAPPTGTATSEASGSDRLFR